jgi:hypothetical protein
VGDYTWHILEPEILKEDYAALMHVSSITSDEDYGELKRHRWEFQRATSFAYGVLTPDGTEVACVYVNPSKKQGYDAAVRIWLTESGAASNLGPALEAKVREWIKTSWPFAKVAYPGLDVPMPEWNALPDTSE